MSIETCGLDGGQRTAVLSDNSLLKRIAGNVAWLADGRVLFTVEELPPNERNGNIWAIDVDPDTGRARGQPSQVTHWTGFNISRYWRFGHSGDGKRLVFTKHRELDVVKTAETRSGDGEAGAPRRLGLENWEKHVGPWASDSQSLFTTTYRDGRWEIDKQNLQEPDSHMLIAGVEGKRPEISPDGTWLLYHAIVGGGANPTSSALMRAPIEGGPASLVLLGGDSCSCSRSPASLCVVSEQKEEKLVISFLDPVAGLGREIVRLGKSLADSQLSLSPDGKNIALVNGDNQVRFISTDTGLRHSVNVGEWSWLQGVSWHPDGSCVFVGGRAKESFGILSVDTAGNAKVLVRAVIGQGYLHNPRVSPDGHYLAFDERTFESNLAMLEGF